MSSASNFIENLENIREKLIQYIYSLWLLFGLTGGILNLLVFSRKKLRNTSCCICKGRKSFQLHLHHCDISFVHCLDLLATSVDHLLTLVIGIVPILYSLNHPDPQLTSIWFCKLRNYLFQICLMLSRWFVAFACIDRYMLTSELVHRRNLATKNNSYRIITFIIVFWFIICTHRLFFYEIQGNLCGILTNTSAAFYQSLYVIIGGGFLPGSIMIICAYLIRQNLRRKIQRQIQWNLLGQRRNTLNDQVHHLLLIQCLFFIIVTLPQLANLLFNAISIRIVNRSEKHLEIERFCNFFAELVLHLFPVTSFYLYTLTSRTFRREFLNLFRLKTEVTPVVAVLTVQQYLRDDRNSIRSGFR